MQEKLLKTVMAAMEIKTEDSALPALMLSMPVLKLQEI